MNPVSYDGRWTPCMRYALWPVRSVQATNKRGLQNVGTISVGTHLELDVECPDLMNVDGCMNLDAERLDLMYVDVCRDDAWHFLNRV